MEPMGIIKNFIEKTEMILKNRELNIESPKEESDPEFVNKICQYMNSLK